MSKEVERYTLYPQLKPEALMFLPDVVVDAKAYDALLEENKKLRQLTSEKVINATMLREFVARDGGLTIGLEGGACALMAQAFGQQLYESEALNYIEASFDSPDYPELGQITVTLKREAGKTPHQLRREAEAERDALLAERDALSRWKQTAEYWYGQYRFAKYGETPADHPVDGALDAWHNSYHGAQP